MAVWICASQHKLHRRSTIYVCIDADFLCLGPYRQCACVVDLSIRRLPEVLRPSLAHTVACVRRIWCHSDHGYAIRRAGCCYRIWNAVITSLEPLLVPQGPSPIASDCFVSSSVVAPVTSGHAIRRCSHFSIRACLWCRCFRWSAATATAAAATVHHHGDCGDQANRHQFFRKCRHLSKLPYLF